MLNLFKNKTKNKPETTTFANDRFNNNINKDFPSSTTEWKNSVYNYNKNALALIPEASKSALGLIKGYLNLYRFKLEKKLRRKKINIRKRIYSFNRIFVNRGEFKHTNNNVIVNLFIYNRQKKNLISKIKKFKKLYVKSKFRRQLLIIGIFHRVFSKEVLKYLGELDNENYSSLLLRFKESVTILIYKIVYKKFALYLYYKQLVFLNKSKFEYSYLKGLINLLKKIFNKNIEFNIVNLKYFYLNSDIFSQPLFIKIMDTKSRKYLKLFQRYLWRIKISNKNQLYFYEKKNYNGLLENNPKIKNIDPLSKYISKFYLNNNNLNVKSLKKTVIDSIKYKKVRGVRLEIKGRLSKRFTAARSVYKVKYKGNLKNRESSLNSLSTVLLRGNFRSNLQYTYLNSKTRIGSFGLKGWVSGS